jgi:NAD(P)-dependent dehydrogenase (short-subunit alcohol dehydrogenase family)
MSSPAWTSPESGPSSPGPRPASAWETARSLARAGAEVTLAVRNTGAGEQAAENIAKSTGNDGVHVAALDLSDRAAVAGFVQSWHGPLHLLINNAESSRPPCPGPQKAGSCSSPPITLATSR